MSKTQTDMGVPTDRLKVQRRLILFFAILASGGNLLIPRELLALVILLISILYFRPFSGRVKTRNLLIYGWLALVIILTFVRFQPIDVVQNVTRLINFVIALVLLRIYTQAGRDKLFDDLRTLITPMSYQAIATVLLAFITPEIFTFIEAESQSFYSFLGVLNYHVQNYSSTFVRPDGFFWEPGVFQIYLNILLFILFVQHAPVRTIAVVLAATLVTQSTTGILIATAQVFYFSIIPLFLRGKTYRKLIIFITVLALSPVFYSFTKDNLNEKLTGASVGSSAARLYDFQSGVLVLQEHPLLGIGFNPNLYVDISVRLNPDTSMLNATAQKSGRFNTNGLLIALYSLGLPLGLMYIVALMFQGFVPHRLAFGGLLLLCISSEPLSLTPFFAMFAFSGLRLRLRRPIRYSLEQRVSEGEKQDR